MHWLLKAAAHNFISYAPFGQRLHHFAQVRHGTALSDDAKFLDRVGSARRHFEWLSQYSAGPAGGWRCYEFGAGWDLVGPLTYWALGIEQQLLIDIEDWLRVEAINTTVARFQRYAGQLRLLRTPSRPVSSRADLACYGIDYRAPCDARRTGLPDRSVDCITSAIVFEHVPARDVAAILGECRRLLRPGGIFTGRIDYRDHYSYTDGRLTQYNFLRYSDRVWRWLSPPTHYQNRLRHRDYLEMFKVAGLQVAEIRCHSTTPADLEALRSVPLAPRWSHYSAEELAVKAASFIVRT